jgi:hypothetical protein
MIFVVEQVTTQARILPNISKSKKLVLFDLCQPDGKPEEERNIMNNE